jgi:hypothetical protein
VIYFNCGGITSSHPWNGEVISKGHRIPRPIELKDLTLVVEEEYGSTKNHGARRDEQPNNGRGSD